MDYIQMELLHQEDFNDALERAMELSNEKEMPVKFEHHFPNNPVMVFPVSERQEK